MLTVWAVEGADAPYLRLSGRSLRAERSTLRVDADLAGARVVLPLHPVGFPPSQLQVSGLPHGELPVRLVVRTMEGDSLAGTSLILDVRAEHVYWVTVRTGRSPLAPGGCGYDVPPIPLPPGATTHDATSRDTLFVRYGGAHIHAIC